jgi:hypothetical protein
MSKRERERKRESERSTLCVLLSCDCFLYSIYCIIDYSAY